MKCKNCKNKVDPHSNFCPTCGSKIELPKEKSVSTNRMQQRLEQTKLTAIILGIFGILSCFTILPALLLGGFGISYALAAKRKDKTWKLGIMLNVIALLLPILLLLIIFLSFATFQSITKDETQTTWCCAPIDEEASCNLDLNLLDDHTYEIRHMNNQTYQGTYQITKHHKQEQLTLKNSQDNIYSTFNVKRNKHKMTLYNRSNQQTYFCYPR